MKVSRLLTDIKEGPGCLELITNAALYRIYLMNDDIIRIRCTFEEKFGEEASYALAMTAWDDKMDAIIPDRIKLNPLPVMYEETDSSVLLSTASLNIVVHKKPFAIEIQDKDGVVLHADVKDRAYVQDKQGRSYHYSEMGTDDYYYGFGEKSGHLNKRKRRLRMHNVDTIGYDAERTDPLYKHIPFYIKFNGSNRQATGIFYHNAYDSVFDIGCERSGYWTPYSYFCADGGELDYFFIHGPQIKDVIRHYTDLTGKTMMPTKYSLGYMGSTMFYTELEQNADQAILGFLDRCHEEDIPCDGFFMSSGYTTGPDGKRYVFNWNYDRFPNPDQFIEALMKKGAALVPNIKPGMLLTHPYYQEFAEAGAYVMDNSGVGPETDRYWGGTASFVDFTKPEARALWKKHLKDSFLSRGVTSIWNDNNEYEIHNTDAICHYEGNESTISALRPIMPNMMALTAIEAIAEEYPNTRPYVVNRAGFAGIQRYAQTWSGDNHTSWHSLKFNIPIMLGMGLSGVANQGCDIGGFYGPAPEPELFVRWVQNGIFQPRFSIHSCNTDNTVTEPWMFPSYTSYIRDAIKLRYSLVPYLYTLLHEASVEGSPVMRPLVYEFQQDEQVWEESFDFMLGPSLFIANVLEPGAVSRSVYFPKGSDWIDWHTKKRYSGGQVVELPVDLSSIPMFIRSGSVIPLAENLRNIHQDTLHELKLIIEPSVNTSFSLYDDDGTTNEYKNGQYLITKIDVQAGEQTTINFSYEGQHPHQVKQLSIDLICMNIAPIDVYLQGTKLPMLLGEREWVDSRQGWYYDLECRVAKLKFEPPHHDYEVDVHFTNRDLISI